jgi:hypothetical protein
MIKQTLFTGWNLVRWLRLALGVFIAFQAIETRDLLSGTLSALLLFQAFTNVGCCGITSCATPTANKNNTSEIEEPIFEELKIK